MNALIFENTLRLEQRPRPCPTPGEVLIRVIRAGICNTDLEILRGYVPGFSGIPGHEFIGIVEQAEDAGLIGKRVTAEINIACGSCDWCARDLGRHCPTRSVLGIINRDGTFAEYVTVPRHNVVVIPDNMSNDQAIFIEPLAAALEIEHQIPITENHRFLVVGDGKLGQLIARVLSKRTPHVLAAGRHANKLAQLRAEGIEAVMADECKAAPRFDIVVECSGNPSGWELARGCVKPRGTIVLKSTFANELRFNPSPLVVDEVTVVGSRCGEFSWAIEYLQEHQPDFSGMISAEYPFAQAVEAIEHAQRRGVLKVVLAMRE